MNHDKYLRNFRKSLALIDTCFTLKEAYLKSKHPGSSEETIRRMVYEDVLKRKERQWKRRRA